MEKEKSPWRLSQLYARKHPKLTFARDFLSLAQHMACMNGLHYDGLPAPRDPESEVSIRKQKFILFFSFGVFRRPALTAHRSARS